MTYLLLVFFLLISACTSAQTENRNTKRDAAIDPDKVLIVYLSRTNNTKAIAEMIHKKVGGTLVALELETPSGTPRATRVKFYCKRPYAG